MFKALIQDRLLALSLKLRHGKGNGIVQTTVEDLDSQRKRFLWVGVDHYVVRDGW